MSEQTSITQDEFDFLADEVEKLEDLLIECDQMVKARNYERDISKEDNNIMDRIVIDAASTISWLTENNNKFLTRATEAVKSETGDTLEKLHLELEKSQSSVASILASLRF